MYPISSDNASHFFLLLVRHGDHVVFTQMVGTHDAMVKGTLDIPNLIKFKDIAQTFRLDVEVYGMVGNTGTLLKIYDHILDPYKSMTSDLISVGPSRRPKRSEAEGQEEGTDAEEEQACQERLPQESGRPHRRSQHKLRACW